MTIWWNKVTKGWIEVAWNEVVMERSDWIPSSPTPSWNSNRARCHVGMVTKPDVMLNSKCAARLLFQGVL